MSISAAVVDSPLKHRQLQNLIGPVSHLAGLRCIAVPNDYTRHHDFSKVTRICRSLTEISAEFIRALKSPVSGF